jgi:hypothetical protein
MSMSLIDRVIPFARNSPRISPARCAIGSVIGSASQAFAKKSLNQSPSFLFGFQLKPNVISSRETTLMETRSTPAAQAITPRLGIGRTSSLRTFVSARCGIQHPDKSIRTILSRRHRQFVILATKQVPCLLDAISDCETPGDSGDVRVIDRDDSSNQAMATVNELRLRLATAQYFGELLFRFPDSPSVLVHIVRPNASKRRDNSRDATFAPPGYVEGRVSLGLDGA